ncbi:GAF domain-containing protein [Streptomyces sp. NPDC093510]|uniref:GAF domain-containing protein n=1 Tax=Streptomyces sp. NPDC093510 TaxID=3155199 RepID=UPI00341EA8A4
MPTYNNATGRHRPPVDTDLEARLALLKDLGVDARRPIAELDALAARFADSASAHSGGQPLIGIVNIITHDQYFAGLSTPRTAGGHSSGQTTAASTERTMSRNEGWCVFTVDRRKAFPLDNVLDYPRSAGNPAIYKLRVRTYLGAPMIHPATGIILGTACVIGRQVTAWDSEAVDLSKHYAEEAVELLTSDAVRRALL